MATTRPINLQDLQRELDAFKGRFENWSHGAVASTEARKEEHLKRIRGFSSERPGEARRLVCSSARQPPLCGADQQAPPRCSRDPRPESAPSRAGAQSRGSEAA